MEIGKTLYVTEKKEWRSWLAKNHAREREIWLVFYKKCSGKPRISYSDALDQALCFGWIDSTVKRIDEHKYAQRFTPRRPKSNLSEANRERINRLIKSKKMTRAGFKAVSHAFGKQKPLRVSPDVLRQIKANKKAWENFQKLPDGYKRVRLGYIGHRRHTDTAEFQKRLNYFIKMTAQNKRFGLVR